MIQALMDGNPGFDQIIKAVETVGFPVVVVILLLSLVVTPMFLLARTIVSSVIGKSDDISKSIAEAVTLFAGTLSNMSTRQEVTMDKVADAMVSLTGAVQELGKLTAEMNGSIRIQLNQTSQQMTQQAALTQKISDATGGPPVTGIIKPVEAEGGC